jgi:preprotein translocase subunit YajC
LASLIAATSAAPLLLIVVLAGLAWIFLVRPSKRRQVKQSSMLDNIAPGDEILTAGGFYGFVRAVEDDQLTVEIAPGTNVRVAKRAVAAVIPPDEEEEPEPAENELTPGKDDEQPS